VSKNAEFHADFESVEKMYQKKVISKNVTEKCTFFTFTYVRQTCFAYNFFWCIFSQLFQRIRNQREILRFLTPFSIFSKKNFFSPISVLFSNFEAKRAKKRLKKLKNVFCKCVLDFNFAPIKGSVFFIFKKKVKFVVPYWVCAFNAGMAKTYG